MSIIQFKRGTTGPTGLTLGEPAWDYSNNRFYIGVTSDAIWVGGGITTGNIDNGSTNLIPTQSAVKTYVDSYSSISGGGVSAINGLTGALTITGGTGISVTQQSKTITISNILGSGLTLLAAITFTSTPAGGIYTIPSGAKLIIGNCVGAGSGGAPGGISGDGIHGGRGGEGGAGGAYWEFIVNNVQSIGATCVVTIGAGGGGGVLYNTDPGRGGESRFHNFTFAGSRSCTPSTTSQALGYIVINGVKGPATGTALATSSTLFGQAGFGRAPTNNDGNSAFRGYKGGGGGGGGAPKGDLIGNGFTGGVGGSSSNIVSDVASMTAVLTGNGGQRGERGTSSTGGGGGGKGADGTIYYGGAGGGGGGSCNIAIAGRGGDGGYPGGGGGGGGGTTGGITRAAGGTGGDARIMIWVYG